MFGECIVDLDSLFIRKNTSFDFYEVDISSATDKQLQGISDHMGLALAEAEMKRIKDYFKSKNRNPTDKGYTHHSYENTWKPKGSESSQKDTGFGKAKEIEAPEDNLDNALPF